MRKFLILILFLLGYVLVSGQSDNSNQDSKSNNTMQYRHPLTDMPGPSEDVVTSFYFPAHPDQKLPIGETVSMLCHFANDGKTSLNVTAIMASLNSPYDFNFYIQNMTYKPIGFVVKGGEEITLEYQFQVHPMLEPVDFTLASVIFYESDELMYSNTFFNQTVELYLPVNDWDITTIFQVIFGLFSTGLVGVMLYYACSADKPLPFKLPKTKKPIDELEFENDRKTPGKKGKSRKD